MKELQKDAEIWVNNRFTKQIIGDKIYSDIYTSKEAVIESHILFTEYIQKKLYSEENLKEALYYALSVNKSNGIIITTNSQIVRDTIKFIKQIKCITLEQI